MFVSSNCIIQTTGKHESQSLHHDHTIIIYEATHFAGYVPVVAKLVGWLH